MTTDTTPQEKARLALLHVIDISSPDEMVLLSSLGGIAPDEELHGAYFVGDMVYIVTWFPQISGCGQWGCDPLWIISLEDPENPEVLGELELPGWSDFVFPLGDRLLGVGRGQFGDSMGMAYFDISDPRDPQLLTRLEVGAADASSEAILDFRGVTIVPAGELGENGLVTLPVSDTFTTDSGCLESFHYMQFVDIERDALTRRGSLDLDDTVRRAVAVDSHLYTIDDLDVTVVDLSNRGRPSKASSVQVGEGSGSVSQCLAFGDFSDAFTDCSVVPGPRGSTAVELALLLGLGLLISRRSRRG